MLSSHMFQYPPVFKIRKRLKQDYGSDSLYFAGFLSKKGYEVYETIRLTKDKEMTCLNVIHTRKGIENHY